MGSMGTEKQLAYRALCSHKRYFHTDCFATFWTGLEKFNSTHFMGRSLSGEINYYIISNHFERFDITFFSSVIHNVPRYNIESCPKVQKIFREGTVYVISLTDLGIMMAKPQRSLCGVTKTSGIICIQDNSLDLIIVPPIGSIPD